MEEDVLGTFRVLALAVCPQAQMPRNESQGKRNFLTYVVVRHGC